MSDYWCFYLKEFASSENFASSLNCQLPTVQSSTVVRDLETWQQCGPWSQGALSVAVIAVTAALRHVVTTHCDGPWDPRQPPRKCRRRASFAGAHGTRSSDFRPAAELATPNRLVPSLPFPPESQIPLRRDLHAGFPPLGWLGPPNRTPRAPGTPKRSPRGPCRIASRSAARVVLVLVLPQAS